MKIYLSGQIAGLPIEQAVAAFRQAEDEVRTMGFDPANPFDNGLTEEHSWEHHMSVDIATLLIECEAIYMLQGWQKSRGARIEHMIGLERGIKIIYQPGRSDNSLAGMKMPFGKYKDTPMASVPPDYLMYLYDNGMKPGSVKSYIDANIDELRAKADHISDCKAALRSMHG